MQQAIKFTEGLTDGVVFASTFLVDLISYTQTNMKKKHRDLQIDLQTHINLI